MVKTPNKEGIMSRLKATALVLIVVLMAWGTGISYAHDDGGGGSALSPPTVTGELVDEGDCHYAARLSWNAVPGATSYLIYNADNDDYLGQTTSTTALVRNLTPGRQYHFYVKSHGDTGNSEKSNIVMIYAPECDSGGIPSAPCNLNSQVVDKGNCEYEVHLGWCAVSGATSYKIYEMEGDVLYPLGTVTSNSATITGVEAGHTYHLAVTAINDSGESDLSSVVTVTIPGCGSGGGTSTLPAPQHLTYNLTCSSVQGCYTISLSWDAVSGATSYTAYCTKNGETRTYNSTVTNAVFGPTCSSHYLYTYSCYVIARNSQGESDKSNVVTFQEPDCGGGLSPAPTDNTVTTTVSNANDLTNALNNAANNGKPDVIVMNPGTYNGNFIYVSTNGDNQPLTIKGTSGTSPSSIIIDAGKTGSGITLIDTNPSHTNSNFTVSGITVQNGKAPSSNNAGGGINITTSGNISVSNTITRNNSAGQGGGISAAPIRTSGSSVIISGNSLSGNTATTGGGGLVVTSPSGNQVSVSGNTIASNNGGPLGGGILISIASGSSGGSSGGLVISGNSISSNSATSGGGIAVTSPSGTATVNIGGNSISSNTATTGGGISVSGAVQGTISSNTLNNNNANQGGGGLSIASTGSLTVSGNTINSNSAPAGGGVMVSSGTITLVNNIVSANTARSGGGGGVSVTPSASSALVLINNLISGNSAPQGGGVGMSSTTSGVPAVLINNTIVGNTATSGTGSGVHLVVPAGSSSSTTGLLVNNIIRRTSASVGSTDISISMGTASSGGGGTIPPGILHSVKTMATTTNGLVVSHNNFFSESAVDLPVSLDSTNTYSDPGFVNEAAGDYHLSAASPLKDSGEVVSGMGSTDFEGDPRILGSAPDIGADEYIPERIEKLYPPNGTERHYSGDLSQDGLLVFAWYLPKTNTSVAGYNLHLALIYPGGSTAAEGDIFLDSSTGLIVLNDYGIAGWVLPLDETTWNALEDWEIDWSATGCTKANDKSSGVAGTTWGTFVIK